MRKMYKNHLGTMALAFLLCLGLLAMSGTAFAERCVDNLNGTVTYNYTDLMWQKATAGPMNWHAAMSYASSLSLGGHSGWRLPDRFELMGVYNYPCKDVMDVRMERYWSSNTLLNHPEFTWYFDYSNGYHGYVLKSTSYYVRAVRAAQ